MVKLHTGNKFSVDLEVIEDRFHICIMSNGGIQPISEDKLFQYVKEYVCDFNEIILGWVSDLDSLNKIYEIAKDILTIVDQYKDLT